MRCLNVIENAGGLTAGELARQVGVTTGAVTGALDRLERAGYARRVPDPGDRRRVRVEVTAAFPTAPRRSGRRSPPIGSVASGRGSRRPNWGRSSTSSS